MRNFRKREIRAKASDFRSGCKIGKYGIIDIFEECDRHGFKLLRMPLGENSDLGFVLKRDGDIVIFTNSSMRLSREIFTLAHEFGHAALHFEQANSFVDDSVSLSEKSDDEMEQEANYFAVCMLLPQEKLKEFLDIETIGVKSEHLSAIDVTKIMTEFKVSYETVLNRLENLSIIDENERKRLDNEKNEKRVGNLLNVTGGDRRLNVPSLETAIPFEYLDYAIYNYNHGAIPLETLEKVLACYNITKEDISDKMADFIEKEVDLDELIGGTIA
ncbi:MAG TPA: ImmA/IrrE family metallo-endopeptidase [Lachnospiraceae bacterium]|mgnify:CR=1 FL=1|nr:ImmA/IrrE family metallo-endopeptidase [Lachnospiraceae bacterium]